MGTAFKHSKLFILFRPAGYTPGAQVARANLQPRKLIVSGEMEKGGHPTTTILAENWSGDPNQIRDRNRC